jgi:histidinol phosphatase-like PHP family hydrolase
MASEPSHLSNAEIADRLAGLAQLLSANEAGGKIAVSTDAHSTREFGTVRHGIDQAGRAGLEVGSILNCKSWNSLEPLFRR